MKPKHTPGPWVVERGDVGDETYIWTATDIVGADGFPVVSDTGLIPEGLAFKYETTEANARLIAAAPDLLEALEDALKFLHGSHTKSVGPTEMQLCDQMEAAIAKARGLDASLDGGEEEA
ncbi:conserved hypothetical protein [Desulfatibacillum aliphaticivorans]|uniref:Uncharacterized protein n=1 Tax=Desulfatibacillum aliphaticivorans TaxID=218208 RepID=B8FCP5_DESAL|nr:hypothetical protein [Desulfatibacillum aliphaticivorans]ACL06208.1 conserved hypothetical protein [Desulfatibacillum aliphaticivorans]